MRIPTNPLLTYNLFLKRKMNYKTCVKTNGFLFWLVNHLIQAFSEVFIDILIMKKQVVLKLKVNFL